MFILINSSSKNLFNLTPYESSTSNTKIIMLHKGDSISETAMQKYKGSPQTRKEYTNVVIIIHPATKVGNPFDMEEKKHRK